jgi:mono/diheme cytochrome c family protein
VYLRSCAPCHGEDARGTGPVASALKTPPPDLTLLADRHGGRFPRDEVIAIIAGERDIRAHGTREMPVWSQRFGNGLGAVASVYTRRRLGLLADHLASIQR